MEPGTVSRPEQTKFHMNASSDTGSSGMFFTTTTARRAGLTLLGFSGLVIMALVLLDSGIKGASLFITGSLLGAVFLGFHYGFASGWRQFLLFGDSRFIAAHFALISLCSVLFLSAPLIGISAVGALAPVSVSLFIGAFMFGIGMQLANGCGSGVLFSFGSGSIRMLVALPFFIIGSVLGSLWVPDILAWGSVNPVRVGDGILYIVLTPIVSAALAGGLVYLGVKRGFVMSRKLLYGTGFIAVLCGCAFVLAGHPWGVTFGFTLWGAKLVQFAGLDIAHSEFWSWAGPARALSHSVLADASSLMNIGMVLGASALALWNTQFGGYAKPPSLQLVAAAIGGLLMGVGARLAFGCNIGAFVGGIASGSLHGWLWFALALAGSWVGLKIRPLFGFSDKGKV